MKSENLKTINEFWRWFSNAIKTVNNNIENPAFVDELNKQVQDLNPKLSWEIGPGLIKPWQLVISPGLDPDLRQEARGIISDAPALPDWEFHSAKPPKQWDYKLELENADGDLIRLSAANWTFVLLRYPDGAYEVLLKGNDISHLRDDERWQAAAVTLESILGEDVVLDRINEFELVENLEPRLAQKQRPIQELRTAVMGLTDELPTEW